MYNFKMVKNLPGPHNRPIIHTTTILYEAKSQSLKEYFSHSKET